jgi:hypothetical protein
MSSPPSENKKEENEEKEEKENKEDGEEEKEEEEDKIKLIKKYTNKSLYKKKSNYYISLKDNNKSLDFFFDRKYL